MQGKLTAWFVLGGKPNEHYTYKVKKLRDGYNYCTRSVSVFQIAAHGAMFTCTCSFKRDESSPVDVQENIDLKEIYRDVLEGKENEPMDHVAAPSVDSDYHREIYLPNHPQHFNPIGGLHLRKVDMAKSNAKCSPIDRRQLIYYTLRGSLPLPTAPFPPPPTAGEAFSITREANMHACAHLYASDRNSLFIIPNHFSNQKTTHAWRPSRTASFSTSASRTSSCPLNHGFITQKQTRLYGQTDHCRCVIWKDMAREMQTGASGICRKRE